FALSLGAERFIVKPAEPDVFMEMVQEVIKNHEAGRLVAPREPIKEEEAIVFQQYSERLVKKLEDKMAQLQEANRALERYAQEAARQRDRLQLLHRVDRAISGTLALPELLDQLARELVVALEVNRCSAWLLDESGEFLQGRGYGIQPGEPDVGNIRLPRTEPLVARLFETGQPVMIPDANDLSYADVVNLEYSAAFHIRAFLAVPLVARGEVTGFVVLDDTRAPRVFQPEEVQLVQSVATQAAISIENARLYERVKGHVAHLEERVRERTAELRNLVNAMAGREVRMAELKDVIRQLRAQLEAAGLTPVADDPLFSSG
ncbi:MAG: GAF domain-containing protein, partial [Anaerolineae bacterium]